LPEFEEVTSDKSKKYPEFSKYTHPVIRKVTIIESYKNLTCIYPAFEQSFEASVQTMKKSIKACKNTKKMRLKRQN